MRKVCAIIILVCLLSLLANAPIAQTSTFLSLETANTNVQTGQYYDINIRLDDVNELWLANLQISYDPELVYIVGTKSGSPIQQASLFDLNASVVIRNYVQENNLFYTISMLAPAEPISGTGIIASFRIYPLAAGTSQIFFSQGELIKSIFELQNGQRVGVGSEPISFTPVLLELNITGETVEEPSEATATPLPSETPLPQATANSPTEIPTLVNVTAAPRSPEASTTQEVPNSEISSNSGLPLPLIFGIGLLIIGALGLMGAFAMMWRKK